MVMAQNRLEMCPRSTAVVVRQRGVMGGCLLVKRQSCDLEPFTPPYDRV